MFSSAFYVKDLNKKKNNWEPFSFFLMQGVPNQIARTLN